MRRRVVEVSRGCCVIGYSLGLCNILTLKDLAPDGTRKDVNQKPRVSEKKYVLFIFSYVPLSSF